MKMQEKKICKRLFENKEIEKLIDNYQINGTYETKTYYEQPITWYRLLDQLPSPTDGFTVFLANEFFDAFPIHKFAVSFNSFFKVIFLIFVHFQKVNNEWREILVDLDPLNPNALRWIRSKNETPSSKMFAADQNVDGDHLEVCPQTIIHIEKIVDRINQHDGKFCVKQYLF